MSDSSPPPVSAKPPSSREDALAVVRRLREAGHVAYFAGGCVRDALLGLTPKDYDVATDAPPDRVRELFKRTQAVGAAFGVILVRQGRSQIEVATFRTDLKYVDGRRPEGVVFTTAEEDAKRRDFTINGIFFDPVDDTVIDFVGGQADLRTKTLRAIGAADERFAEDHLRILRAVRFAARFDLTIEPATAEAIRRNVERLKQISPERIAEELRLMLTPATRVRAYELLREFGVIRVLLRFLPDAGQPVGLFLAIDQPSIPFGLVLAALVLDARGGNLLSQAEIRKGSAAMRQSLKISNDESGVVEGSLAFGNLLQDTPNSVASLKRFLAQPYSAEARVMMMALARFGVMSDRIEPLQAQLRELEQTEYAPSPLITGDDLTAAGLTPGPAFRRALDGVYDAQLEYRVTTKEQALELGLRLAQGN